MAEENTLQMPSRGIADDKRKWSRKIENCETDVCQYGFAIRGLLQSGMYIHIVHDPDVRHSCSFRGVISDEMRAYYNSNPPPAHEQA